MTYRRLLRARKTLLLAIPLAIILGACSEDLETGGVCPSLCPGQQLEVLDTVLTPAVVLDTTLAPYPLLGFEKTLLLAARGDTLDVRGVIRFDTLARIFRRTPADTNEAISRVDSATLNIRIARTGLPLPATFFIDVYDVGDKTLNDTMPQLLLPFFTAARLVGTKQIDSAGFTDTTLVRIPIDTAYVLDNILDTARVLRLGLRVRSAAPVEVRVSTSEDANRDPILRYRVSPDTTIPAASVEASSITPTNPLFQAPDLIDYSIIVDAPTFARPGTFAVGGMPGVRSYLRFELPRWLTDSSTVLRARLELVQDPVRGLDESANLVIRGFRVLAGHQLTDLNRAALLLDGVDESFSVRDSIVLAPGDSGVRQLEINGLIRQWRTLDGVRLIPNALVLRTTQEGSSALSARFFGLGGPVELRPRLRISYVPNTSFTFGQP